MSHEGVLQGDPLAPVLFTLGFMLVMAALQRSLGSSDTAPTQQQPPPRTQNGKKAVAVVQPKSHMAPRSKVDYSREMTQSPGRGRRYESRHQLQEAPMQRGGMNRARSPGLRYNKDPWKASKQEALERKRQGQAREQKRSSTLEEPFR